MDIETASMRGAVVCSMEYVVWISAFAALPATCDLRLATCAPTGRTRCPWRWGNTCSHSEHSS